MSLLALPSVRSALSLLVLCGLAGCEGTPTTAPTPAPAVVEPSPPPPPPKVIEPAQFRTSGFVNYVCSYDSSEQTYCHDAVVQLANTGPGCGRITSAVVRFFGNDGRAPAPQLGVDVRMDFPSGGLLSYVWKPGVTLAIRSQNDFNDVRSAHSVFLLFETHADVECPQ